jgi:hypothetical protein
MLVKWVYERLNPFCLSDLPFVDLLLDVFLGVDQQSSSSCAISDDFSQIFFDCFRKKVPVNSNS